MSPNRRLHRLRWRAWKVLDQGAARLHRWVHRRKVRAAEAAFNGGKPYAK